MQSGNPPPQSIGDPLKFDFRTPPHLVEAVVKAMRDGKDGYAPSLGVPEAIKAVPVNHYSFRILDPEWGHLTIIISGHPPFPAQMILNGHEYVDCQARKAGIRFTKEGNWATGSWLVRIVERV